MNPLRRRSASPRGQRRPPRYPRVAALAVAAALCGGCKEEVALAGDVAPVFEPDATASATPPASNVPEPVLKGDIPAPFEPEPPSGH